MARKYKLVCLSFSVLLNQLISKRRHLRLSGKPNLSIITFDAEAIKVVIKVRVVKICKETWTPGKKTGVRVDISYTNTITQR
jgi:hypothetical protein